MIFLTGATGFVGGHLARHLSEAGLPVRALVRSHSGENKSRLKALPDVEVAKGDVLQPQSLMDGLRGCDTVIHLVGIIRETKNLSFQQAHVEATRNVAKAAQANGIKRFIQMSALGTRANAVTPYHQTKWQAEEIVRASGLDWTIFRPSMIYGEGSEFIASMLGLARAPITPIIAPGMNTGLLQPIHVDDLASCFVQAAQDAGAQTGGQIHECGGPERLTTEQVLDTLARIEGRQLRKVRVPLPMVKLAMSLGEKLRLPVPATSGQLAMLQENNVCDIGEMSKTFSLQPRSFEAGVRPVIVRLGGGKPAPAR